VRISAHLDRFFSAAVVVAQSTAEAMRSGRLDPSKLDDLQRQFVGQMRYYPYLTFISFGRPDGQYVGATRLVDTNEVRLVTAFKNEGMTVDTYGIDDNNGRGARLFPGPVFDATKRGWYKQAEEKGRMSWYPVYKYSTYESLGVGVSLPVFERGSQRPARRRDGRCCAGADWPLSAVAGDWPIGSGLRCRAGWPVDRDPR
jgi:hypothetical protein